MTFSAPRSRQRSTRRPARTGTGRSPLPPGAGTLAAPATVHDIAARGALILDFNGLAKGAHTGKPTKDGKRPLCIREALTQATPAGQKPDRVLDGMHRFIAAQGFGGMAPFSDRPETTTGEAVAMVYDFAAYAKRRDDRAAVGAA